jgi:hypothetical protein
LRQEAIEGVSRQLHSLQKLDGLVACFLNPHTGTFRSSSTVSMGASADSYYEYLLKQWIQTGKTHDWSVFHSQCPRPTPLYLFTYAMEE